MGLNSVLKTNSLSILGNLLHFAQGYLIITSAIKYVNAICEVPLSPENSYRALIYLAACESNNGPVDKTFSYHFL